MTTTEQQNQTELLDILQKHLEEIIYNYALDEVEDLNDEEYDQIVRTMHWSRGDKDHWVVITPYGQIRSTSKSSPKDLIVQISNATIDLYATAFDDTP
jgi:hypothetical protein